MKKITKEKDIASCIEENSGGKFRFLKNGKYFDFYIFFLNGYNVSVYNEGDQTNEIKNGYAKDKKSLIVLIKNIISTLS